MAVDASSQLSDSGEVTSCPRCVRNEEYIGHSTSSLLNEENEDRKTVEKEISEQKREETKGTTDSDMRIGSIPSDAVPGNAARADRSLASHQTDSPRGQGTLGYI